MPKNKNYQKRISVLDECLSHPTARYTLQDFQIMIQERLETSVSIRTLQNDLSDIETMIEDELSATVDFDQVPVFEKGLFQGKKKVFKYSSVQYALGNQLLSKTDQEQLEDTLSILSRYRNRADFKWLDELFPRIEHAFELVHQDHLGLISYQNNRDYTGQSWVGKLYNQLLRKKVLKIRYQTFAQEQAYIRTIHPYHLKQYNNRWFLFGYEANEKYQGITNLALDRIVAIQETSKNIIENTIDWGDYFDDIMGVSKPQNTVPVKIKLRFTPNRISYVITKPIHGASQRLDKTDAGGRTILIEVIPNRELYQNLLSFGKDVEVIAPLSVREEWLRLK